MKWLSTVGTAIAGLLLVVGFGMLGRAGRHQQKAEARTELLLAEGTEKALAKAVKETAKAKKFKAKAKEAAQAGKVAIDGVKDEELRTIIGNWTT